jgi:hypothetical protein
VVAAGLSEVAVIAFSVTHLAYRWFGSEGSAWLGISVGLPIALVVGSCTFGFVCWKVVKFQIGSESQITGDKPPLH